MKLKPLHRFYLKCLLLASPFLLLLGIYVADDPFMVLRKYTDYDHSRVCLSEGATAWTKYKMLRNERHYDSFIMGNSCTRGFLCSDWKQHIQGSPFRFFSNAEGLGDICVKLEALAKEPNQPVADLLIVADLSTLENDKPRGGIMHIMPPDVTGKSWISYQATFLQGFLSPKFLLPYLKYLFTRKFEKSMEGIIAEGPASHERYTNDHVPFLEDSIRLEGERFWQQRIDLQRVAALQPKTAPRVIEAPQTEKLKEIADFCRQHHTRLRFVLIPNIEQERIHPHDVDQLKQVLGAQNVYDFSADSLLSNYHNFYDWTHFRVTTGRTIMDRIYPPQDQPSAPRK